MLRLAKLFVMLNVVFAASVSAQSPSGSLRGAVQDSRGDRITSALITARSPATSQARTVACNGRGEFRIDALAPGAWRITVSADGFSDAGAEVQIAVSTVRDVLITLKPVTDSQSIHVSAHGSSIATQPMDVASQIHQGVVTRQDLKTMPLAARNFASIAYLVPGTEPVEPSDPTKGAHHRRFHRGKLRIKQRTLR